MVDKQIFIIILAILAVALIFDAFPSKEGLGISGEPVRSAQSSQSAPSLTPLPMVVYYNPVLSQLWVAKCTDSKCSLPLQQVPIMTAVVDSGGFKPVQLLKGSDDLPVIVVRTKVGQTYQNDIRVIHCGNRSCSSGNEITTVVPSTLIMSFSVDIGSGGMPLIAYIDENLPKTLWLIHCKDVACRSSDNVPVFATQQEPFRDVSFNVALAGDKQEGHISHMEQLPIFYMRVNCILVDVVTYYAHHLLESRSFLILIMTFGQILM